jgi:hypothetical protein
MKPSIELLGRVESANKSIVCKSWPVVRGEGVESRGNANTIDERLYERLARNHHIQPW